MARYLQLIFDSLGYELAQRYPSFRGPGFCPAENSVGNFKRCFHYAHIPIFMGGKQERDLRTRHPYGVWVKSNRSNMSPERALRGFRLGNVQFHCTSFSTDT